MSIALFAGNGLANSVPLPPKQAQWTLAFYLAGENSLEHEQARNLREIIEGAAALKDTRVVVFFDRDERFGRDIPVTSWKGTRVFHITGTFDEVLRSPLDMQLPAAVEAERFEQLILARLENLQDRNRMLSAYQRKGGWYLLKDMTGPAQRDALVLLSEKTDYLLPLGGRKPVNLVAADERTLRQFFSFIGDNFPARRYALFMAGHGNGWYEDPLPGPAVKRGEPPEYRQTLKASALAAAARWRHFDLISMDSCLMADVETLWTLKDAADYLVLNQIETPARGLDYALLLQSLGRDVPMTPRRLAMAVVNSYARSFQEKPYPISSAAFESGRIPLLAWHWQQHFSKESNVNRLLSVLPTLSPVETHSVLNGAMVDMRALGQALMLDDLMSLIEGPQGVIIKGFQNRVPGSGLSIYLPNSQAVFLRTFAAYQRTRWARDFPAGWVKAVQALYPPNDESPEGHRTGAPPRPFETDSKGYQ